MEDDVDNPDDHNIEAVIYRGKINQPTSMMIVAHLPLNDGTHLPAPVPFEEKAFYYVRIQQADGWGDLIYSSPIWTGTGVCTGPTPTPSPSPTGSPTPTPPPSASGKIAFESQELDLTWSIYVMNGDGSGVVRVGNQLGFQPALSPDRTKIAFSRAVAVGNSEIFIINVDGSGMQQLTFSPLLDDQPSFSHDGQKIIFSSNRTGIYEIYIMNPDGTGVVRINNGIGGKDPFLSPDGTKVVFVAGGLFSRIFIMNSDGSGVVQLTTDEVTDDRSPEFDPSGSKIVFGSTNRNGGYWDIFLMNADGTGLVQLTTNDGASDRPTFSPDGLRVAFRSGSVPPSGQGNIYTIRLDGSGRVLLRTNGYGPSWR